MSSRVCLNCKKEIRGRGKIYCSNECQKDFQYKEYIKKWKEGIEDGLRGRYQTSLHIKRYLLEKYNHKCCECGWGEVNAYTGNIPLEIEHIDGNFKNNSEDNLKLLCPNCHSLTSTYKGANISNGRKERIKYNLYS